MKLILIHGAPATGKFSVARALSDLTGVPLVDNHATHEVPRMVFGFGKPGFWELVHELRLTTFAAAARASLPALIVTSAYAAPQDDLLVDDYERTVSAFGGGLLPVYLHCSEETLMKRVTAPDRLARGKIASTATLKDYLARNDFVAIRRDNCLSFSTETAPVKRTAAAIAEALSLPGSP